MGHIWGGRKGLSCWDRQPRSSSLPSHQKPQQNLLVFAWSPGYSKNNNPWTGFNCRLCFGFKVLNIFLWEKVGANTNTTQDTSLMELEESVIQPKTRIEVILLFWSLLPRRTVTRHLWPVLSFQIHLVLLLIASTELLNDISSNWGFPNKLTSFLLARNGKKHILLVPAWKYVCLWGPEGDISSTSVSSNKGREEKLMVVGCSY